MKDIAPNTKDAPEFVGPSVIAKKYGVSLPTVQTWIRKGLFPAVRTGKITRMRLCDVAAGLEKKGEQP